MNKTWLAASLFALAFGVFMVVFGECDDSPGAQLLGVVLAITGIAIAYRAWKSRR